ncbi:MAG: iron-only hydrogenase system regulator, partial [Clostridia bacterium]|nr:iron-only hydrogenase system regulator [Clostridia bacterium]
MEKRISIISIIVEDKSAADSINALLHEYGDHIIGRMGIPYRERGVSVICVVIDAPNDVTSALSGKLGALS